MIRFGTRTQGKWTTLETSFHNFSKLYQNKVTVKGETEHREPALQRNLQYFLKLHSNEIYMKNKDTLPFQSFICGVALGAKIEPFFNIANSLSIA